jgi:hypothetical protein
VIRRLVAVLLSKGHVMHRRTIRTEQRVVEGVFVRNGTLWRNAARPESP